MFKKLDNPKIFFDTLQYLLLQSHLNIFNRFFTKGVTMQHQANAVQI